MMIIKIDDPVTLIGHKVPANRQDVDTVLLALKGDPNGRSEWTWIVLANGDVCLATFPQGELYERLNSEGAFQ